MRVVRCTHILVAGVLLLCGLAHANALDTPSAKPAREVVQELYDTEAISNDLFKDRPVSKEKALLNYTDNDLDIDNDTIAADVSDVDVEPKPTLPAAIAIEKPTLPAAIAIEKPTVPDAIAIKKPTVPEAIAINKPAIHKNANDSNFLVSRISTMLESVLGNATHDSDRNEIMPPPLLLPTKTPDTHKTAKMAPLPPHRTTHAPDDLKPRFNRNPQRRSDADKARLRELPALVKQRVSSARGDSQKARMLPHMKRVIPDHVDAL